MLKDSIAQILHFLVGLNFTWQSVNTIVQKEQILQNKVIYFYKAMHGTAYECHLALSFLLYNSVPCQICYTPSREGNYLLIFSQCRNQKNSTSSCDRTTPFSVCASSHIFIFSNNYIFKWTVCSTCYEAGNMYEFDLITNKQYQNHMNSNTNRGERDWKERRGGISREKYDRNRRISEEEEFYYPLSGNITSLLQREEGNLLSLWCLLAFPSHSQRASKWTGKSPSSKTKSTTLQYIHRQRHLTHKWINVISIKGQGFINKPSLSFYTFSYVNINSHPLLQGGGRHVSVRFIKALGHKVKKHLHG